MSQENVEIVRALFEAIARRDAESAVALVDPGIEVQHRGDIPELTGRDLYGYQGLTEVVATVTADFLEFELQPEEILDGGDEVAVVALQKGIGRASGAAVEKRLHQVWTVRQGKAVRWRIFKTRFEALEAAGLSE